MGLEESISYYTGVRIKFSDYPVFLPPNPVTYSKTEPWPVEFVEAGNERIPLYFLPRKNSKTKRMTTIIYAHGSAADIGSIYGLLKLLHDNLPDVNICSFEYIGYGLSSSSSSSRNEKTSEMKGAKNAQNTIPSETGCYESIEAAYQFLKKKGCTDKDIIFWGTGLGSGPVVEMCSKRGKIFGGLLIENGFKSLNKTQNHQNIQAQIGLKTDKFVNISKMRKIRTPVYVIHGEKSIQVEIEQGKQLYEKVKDEYRYGCLWVEDAEDYDLIETLGEEKFLSEIKKFVHFCCNSNDENGEGEEEENESGSK